MNRVYPPSHGASGRILYDLAHGFAREEWQVTVITTGKKAGTERDGGVKVIRVKGAEKPAHLIAYMWILMKMLWVALWLPRKDLLVSMTDPPMLVVAGAMIQRFKKCAHMHWCQDLYPDVMPALGHKMPDFMMRFLKGCAYKAMKKADKIVVIGRCMAKYLAVNGFGDVPVTMIPNWPDAQLMRASSKQDFNNNQPYELLEGVRPFDQQHQHGPKFRVLYAGNIGRAHPIKTILDAAAILQDSYKDVEILFVGESPRHDLVNRERARRHLDNVRLLPFQPQSRLKDLMESGDVHLASMRDSAAGMLVPVKIYAALGAQRPCVFVGPENTEAAKVIKDYNAGMVTPQGDAQALAQIIGQYRENSDMWFAGYAGAKQAASVFTRDGSINAWIVRAQNVVERTMQDDVSFKEHDLDE